MMMLLDDDDCKDYIVMMMMIDKDGIPKEAQNEWSNNMEPGNNGEEISENRLLKVKCGMVGFHVESGNN